MELPYDEIVNFLDVKFITGSTVAYKISTALYEISNLYLMLKALLPKVVKVNITIDDIRLKSNLTNSKTIKFIKKSFLDTILKYILLYLIQDH